MAYTTIDDPSAHFQTALWSGSGGTQSITFDGNSDMQPDWVWTKGRTIAYNHSLMDSSRGVGSSGKLLFSNLSNAESDINDYVMTLDSDGFGVGAGDAGFNASNDTYVSWCWKANGGTTVTNNDGAVTSTVQANQTAGFSILTYTMNSNSNETVGHGLGVAPEVVITKARQRGDSNGFWAVYTTMIDGSLDYLKLNTTDTVSNSSLSAPTSTVFTGAGSSTASYRSFVAYCFKGIQGYSKFGRYLGTGNANGSFIYTGFKPRWVMVKETGTANSWWMFDTARDTYNTADARLVANTSDAEATGSFTNVVDFLSNGLKFRNSDSAWNGYNRTYFYMCFAENPFVSSDGVPTTAR
jgi:hypothetical protein